MSLTSLRFTVIGPVCAAVLLLAACDAEPTTTNDDVTQAQTSAADAATATASEGPQDEAAGDSSCTAVLADAVPDAVEVTIAADGFSPTTISIPVGGSVTFTAGDDGPHSAQVGDLDAATVMGGLTETFRFDAAGECEVWDEISETTAVVTVG